MRLIVAIEPDRRQAHFLSAMVRHRLKADLLLAESADEAIRVLEGRVPDVILTSALLGPREETTLAEWLRTLDALGAHIQTLTIPVFSTARTRPAQKVRSMFASFIPGMAGLGAATAEPAGAPDGCDPVMFAEQCADYLERARAHRVRIHGEDTVEAPEPFEPIQTFEPIEPFEPNEPSFAASETPADAFEPAPADTPRAPVEFSEFELPRLEAVQAEAPMHDEPMPEAPALSPQEDDPADATPGDAWIPPRLGVERQWPKMDIPDARSAAAAASEVPLLTRPRPALPRPARRVPRGERPIQDEWGFFDPEQCGFAALIAKLHEITEGDDPPAKRPA
jgi:hypothetical protein